MKVLCVDGGGVFGIVPAMVIDAAGTDAVMEKFDMFAGTSIGAVIATSLGMGLKQPISAEYFEMWMPQVFKKTFPRRFLSLLMAKYNDKGLNAALQNVFDGRAYRDTNKPVLVAAASVGSRSLKVFNSSDFSDGSWMSWEVCRAATAAETYFPSWKGLADGGVFANNPSMVAVSGAVRAMGVPVEELEGFSIGTGSSAGYSSRVPRGQVGWGIWLVKAMLDGASDKMHEYFARSMPLKKYVRKQFVRQPSWEMDDPASMRKVKNLWVHDIKVAAEDLKLFMGV